MEKVTIQLHHNIHSTLRKWAVAGLSENNDETPITHYQQANKPITL